MAHSTIVYNVVNVPFYMKYLNKFVLFRAKMKLFKIVKSFLNHPVLNVTPYYEKLISSGQ